MIIANIHEFFHNNQWKNDHNKLDLNKNYQDDHNVYSHVQFFIII